MCFKKLSFLLFLIHTFYFKPFPRVKNIIDPYLKQLKPSAGKDMIKASSKLAYAKIQKHQKQKKKRKHEPSSSSSSGTSASSSSSSSSYSSNHYSSDEDMFQESQKRKKKKYSLTSILPTQQKSDEGEKYERDPLLMSDISISEW